MKVFISSFEFLAPGRTLFLNVLLARIELNPTDNFSFSFESRDVRLYQLFLGRPNQPPFATGKGSPQHG